MLSTTAILDRKVALQEVQSFHPEARGDRHAVRRYLSALRLECEQRRTAWQVYRSVKKEAQKLGLLEMQ